MLGSYDNHSRSHRRRRLRRVAVARCAGFVTASLVLASCGDKGRGWGETSEVTGNACPPVKNIVSKSEVEDVLGGKVNEGARSQFPLLLDVPTCRFDARAESGPATASLAVVNGLADDVVEQFTEQHPESPPVAVGDLGDEAVWFEQPRMLFVRKGTRLLIVQLFLTGPQFNRYRERATRFADKAVGRL